MTLLITSPTCRKQPMVHSPAPRIALAGGVFCALGLISSIAAQVPAIQGTGEAPSITVTATSVAQPAFDTPAAVDVVSGRTLKEGQRQVNLSETLGRVPGLHIGDRQNYAQDLQISSRGFGARASFGVRGIRLYADGIPASMPDGSGQVSHFSLSSAERVEVLRGPFSALHGNAAGGVIAIFSEEAPQGLRIAPSVSTGSYGTWRAGLNAAGTVTHGGTPIGFTFDASLFGTKGARDHSAATRDSENARIKFALSGATTFALTWNRVNMPKAQDPAGLSRAELAANPSQATASALQFNTRKSTYQSQIGGVIEHTFSPANQLRLSAYGGERNIVQFLSTTVGAQAAATSQGGVVDLDRDFYGFDARWIHKGFARDGAYHVTVGVGRELQNEVRRGFENFVGAQLGIFGRLRRDEDNRVVNTSRFIQGEWQAWPTIKLSAGVRHSSVAFTSKDKYIVGTNLDDSGAIKYRATTPAAGVVWSATPRLNFYATVGRGFETPTFAELAYRTAGSGLNFTLKPSTSRHTEAGLKAQFEGGTVSATLFRADTIDEIVTLTNTGGRAIFQNAGRTQRRGAEVALMKAFAASGITLSGAYTWTEATYRDGFLTCVATPCAAPNVPVAAGNSLPAVPRQSLYLEALWRAPRNSAATGVWGSPYAALELRRLSQMFVDDRNSEAAEGYTVANLRAGLEQRHDKWTVSQFMRIDNLANTRYAGSVIVNEANSRFYEPAPGRNWTVGLSAAYRFQ